MVDNPSRGDATNAESQEFTKAETADKETDPDKVANVPMSLKGILDALVGGGSGATHDEDTTHSSGDTGILGLAVQQAVLSSLADDGDYAAPRVDEPGALYTHPAGDKSQVGEQQFSPSAGSEEGVKPSSNGVTGPSCDIWIKNTGDAILWVTSTTGTDTGFELKPDEDTEDFYEGHTSQDDNIYVRAPSGATGTISADAVYKE